VSNELESRLEAALDALPVPDEVTRGRARRAALDALPRSARGRGRLVVVLAAALALLVLGAAALAAIGTIQVTLTPRRTKAPAPERVLAPPGTKGIALVTGGRLWLAAGEARIEGLRARTADLSPHALYAAVGVGRSLVVTAPNGRRAWTLRARGEVKAVSWSPDALKIAYVAGTELRIVEGDGDHDRLVDRRVRAVRPSWRADSLAVAYVGAGGHAVVYDLGRLSRRVVRPTVPQFSSPQFPCGTLGPLRALAFAPAGTALAAASADGVVIAGSRHVFCAPYESRVHPTSLAWLTPNEVAVGEVTDGPPGTSRIWRVRVGAARLFQPGIVESPTGILGLARAGDSLLVARRVGTTVLLQLVGAKELAAADASLSGRSLGRVRGGGPVSLVVR
jgi:hypothetical protein